MIAERPEWFAPMITHTRPMEEIAAAFFVSTGHITHLAGLHIYWQVMAGVGVAVLVIVALASLLSIRRVLVLEPAIVFRG